LGKIKLNHKTALGVMVITKTNYRHSKLTGQAAQVPVMFHDDKLYSSQTVRDVSNRTEKQVAVLPKVRLSGRMTVAQQFTAEDQIRLMVQSVQRTAEYLVIH
jgi:hypothetical protein